MTDTNLIKGIDHLEFYVGNAKQAAHYYSKLFGFTITAYQGLETGERKVTSYLLEQGEIRFLISAALSSDHVIAKSVLTHGDTISVIALEVTDADQCYRQAIAKGAIGVIPPTDQISDTGVLRYSAIHTFGNVMIKFVDRSDYTGCFAPGFIQKATVPSHVGGLQRIDHVVGNVAQGAMEPWVNFFVDTMGFDIHMHFDDRVISTDYSALMSKVLRKGRSIVVNINEPAPGKRKSQIQEFLDFHNGPGIQHIGLETNNIVQTVTQLRQAGVEFLAIPSTYYENLEEWVREVDLPVEKLAQHGILVDRDRDGYLLQLFTKPLGDRPTLFFEIIERHGSQGFGAGNFKSLFVALEREQALRGNL